jgi:hypothetical protein
MKRIVAAAVVYVEVYGLSVIPVSIDKRPMVAWKEYQTRRPTIREMIAWPARSLGIATGALSNIVIVDCESLEDAKWFWSERSKSNVVVKTKRGYHLYFRHPGVPVANGVRIEGRYDLRGDGGAALLPPSTHSAGCYQWCTGHDLMSLKTTMALPVFNPAWRPATRSTYRSERTVEDGVQYIQTITAKSGQNGHNDTYRAACRLRDSGMDEMAALVALQHWNRTNATPPWADYELLHKIRSAYSE